MAKTLVIAEKPSLGRSIASGLTWWRNEQFTRQGKDRNTWLESQNYIVASSVGHLYELIDLDAYFPDYEPGKKHSWTMERLPFFPDNWNFKFEGKDNVKGLIRTINSLMNRTDVDKIYNAGDPDREGQRLVDEIIHYGLKKPKPIYRLWLPDTTNKTVKQAFETAKPNDGYVLRAFLYWKGNDGPDLWNGIDLDLSVVFYGEEKAKFVYYANPKDETLGAIHSGDRRCSGKNGAVEYVDFDIKKCFQNGFRYAALTVKSYSGEKFSEMENAFCGVMVRDGKTGEQFEPATVKDRFALTTDSDQLVMVVIDLMTREVITVDKSVAQFRLACRNVVTDYAPTVAACTYAMQLKSLSIKEMLGMRYAQFLKSDDWKHASVIVSDEPEKFKVTDKDTPAPRIVSPYDIPGVYDLIFGKENQ